MTFSLGIKHSFCCKESYYTIYFVYLGLPNYNHILLSIKSFMNNKNKYVIPSSIQLKDENFLNFLMKLNRYAKYEYDSFAYDKCDYKIEEINC